MTEQNYLESICDKCGFPQSQCKCYPEPEQDEGLLTDEEINNLDNELVNIPEWINETDEYKSFLFSRRYYAKAQLAKGNQKIEELRDRITELEKKLDDREADLIEAKREERERIAIDLMGRGQVGIDALPKDEQGFWKGYWQACIDNSFYLYSTRR